MAISHGGLPLLLLLLVSLFFLPAALGRSAGFVTCNSTADYPVVVNTVEIYPDTITPSTNANITITGEITGDDTSIDIFDGTTVVLNLWSGLYEAHRSYPLCDVIVCPVKPGPIVFTFSNVFTKEELNGRLYRFGIGIYRKDQRGSMPQIMCIEFYCDTSLRRQVTE